MPKKTATKIVVKPEQNIPIAKPKMNAYALAAFILSLFLWVPILSNFTAILAIVLGFIGLKNIRKNQNQRGNEFAIAGVTIGLVTLLLFVIGIYS